MSCTVRPLALLFISAFWIAGCGGGSGDSDGRLQVTTAPALTAPATTPLTRALSLAASESTSLSVTLDDGAGHRFRIDYAGTASSHDVLILGMRPGRTYSIDFELTDARGRVVTGSAGTVTTNALPTGFPQLTVLTSQPAAMEPGLTLLEIHRRDRSVGYLVIVDSGGNVLWYMETDGAQAVTRLGADGLLLTMTSSDSQIRKIDFAGNVHGAWHASGSSAGIPGSIPFDGADLHHDVVELPGGTILTSTRESLRQIDNFPIDENDPNVTATVTIREEPVIEIDANGQIVGRWDFLDMLKPTRIAFDGALGQPDATDWVHLNSIWYDDTDDSIIVSLRHQDAVVKFSRMTGAVQWILSPHDNWEGFEQFLLTPINAPFGWSYHQHAAMTTPDGTLLLFDNGNNKASPFTGQVPTDAAANHSRAVEYRIDEQLMTIEQVWEYGVNQSGEAIYTPFIGDADWLPASRNVLTTFGGICEINGMPSDDIRNCRVSGRVIEVDRDTFTTVFDMHIEDADLATLGYRTYRSDRIPGLYPLGNATITALP